MSKQETRKKTADSCSDSMRNYRPRSKKGSLKSPYAFSPLRICALSIKPGNNGNTSLGYPQQSFNKNRRASASYFLGTSSSVAGSTHREIHIDSAHRQNLQPQEALSTSVIFPIQGRACRRSSASCFFSSAKGSSVFLMTRSFHCLKRMRISFASCDASLTKMCRVVGG